MVVFVPVGQAPHREIEDDPGAEERLEMVELAIADDERFEASRMELEREGPSYTSDTLRELRERAPDDELFLILGGDQAARCRPGTSPRRSWRWPRSPCSSGSSWSRQRDRDQARPAAGRAGDSLPRDAASSRSRRARSGAGRRDGKPIRYLVPDKVADYIESQGAVRRVGSIRGRRRHERRKQSTPRRWRSGSPRSPRTARRSTSAWSTCAGSSATRTSSSSARATPSARPRRSTTRSTEELKHADDRLLPRRTEGASESRWILLDYLDVVVHIFTPEAREYYRLEQLWGEAPARSVG